MKLKSVVIDNYRAIEHLRLPLDPALTVLHGGNTCGKTKAVLRQWQIELREKFNLNWPIYDGRHLVHYPTPALRGRERRPVDPDAWHAERRFREGAADLLLCTDAAAEGLNFQFCGALINYDMPWNPMRVEQRIGRIDRLGQAHPAIRIVNLHCEGTVETDVYRALRTRIHLFEAVVGPLQPILAQLPRTIAGAVLAGGRRRAEGAGRPAVPQASGADAGGRVDVHGHAGALSGFLRHPLPLRAPRRYAGSDCSSWLG